MIIEILPTNKNSRGEFPKIIRYIFGQNSPKNTQDTKQSGDVKYIGTNLSLCIPDPFYPIFEKPSEMLTGNDIDLSKLIKEFENIEQKNKRVKKTFQHVVFSLQVGEKMTRSAWHDLITEYVHKMGYTDNHWVACFHENTNNQHAHLVLSCIENTAPYRKSKDSYNFEKSALIRDVLEDKYSLKNDLNPYKGQRGDNTNNSHVKTKVQLLRQIVDEVINNHSDYIDRISLPLFVDKLVKRGIGCCAKLKLGDVLGLSFSIGSSTFTGRKLGIGYSWPELKKRGLWYESALHEKQVKQMNDDEKKITNLISHGFEKIEIDEFKKNYHYLIIPNEAVKKYPMDKALHSYAICKLWFPSWVKKVKNAQVISDLSQMTFIRQLLHIYFVWSKKNKKSDYSKLDLKIAKVGVGIKYKFMGKGDDKIINTIVKSYHNHKCLVNNGSLLLSNSKMKGGSPKPLVPSSEMTFINF
tara:strand:+ start:8478 stop:9878 length:1401 start_codon:yes stop_codon:yes gene_type:complete